MLKLAEKIVFMKLCDSIPKLFQIMFNGSSIVEDISLLSQKVLYFVSDALGPLLAEQLCNEISFLKGL